MKKITQNHLLALLFATSVPAVASAQIVVAPNNNVGVGTAIPTAKFQVYSSPTNGSGVMFDLNPSGATTSKGLTNTIALSGTGTRYGIFNTVYSPLNVTGNAYGIYNNVSGTKTEAYGLYNLVTQSSVASSKDVFGIYNDVVANGVGGTVYGEYTTIANINNNSQTRIGNDISVLNGTGPSYGINVACFGNSQSNAGWFSGDVFVSGSIYSTSDARTKLNVRNIEGALATVRQLTPRAYEFRQDLGMGLPDGKNFGFIAQDLEKVLPELVATKQAPVYTSMLPGGSDQITTDAADAATDEVPASSPSTQRTYRELKTVNYIALIPILTQALQELADKVDAQTEVISTQAQIIEDLRNQISQR